MCSRARAAFLFMRTSFAEFTFIQFFGSPIFVIFYMLCLLENEFTSVWTYEIPIFIFCKVYSMIRIIVIFFIGRFFVHGKFHVFFHAVFFAVKIIIIRTISGISNRIFRIVTKMPFSINAKSITLRSF